MGQNDDASFSGFVLFRSESAADKRLSANDREVSGARPRADELFRFAITGKRQRATAKRSDVFENCVLLFPIEEVGGRNSPAPLVRNVLPKGDEPIRFTVRQRVQQ